MESVGSNSPAEHDYDPDARLTERIVRALSHRLALLHRSDPNFHILGATGNVYTVTISASGNACTCPDRTVPCKHILFVLLRVLGLPPDDEACLRRRTLRTCQVAYLLSLPTAGGSLAGPRARERFHQVFMRGSVADDDGISGRKIEDGELCPVCLDELAAGTDEIVTCSTCGNSLHGECLKRWKSSRGRRAASCVVCRAKWRERREVEKYVNLSAFVGEEESGEGGSMGLCAR